MLLLLQNNKLNQSPVYQVKEYQKPMDIHKLMIIMQRDECWM